VLELQCRTWFTGFAEEGPLVRIQLMTVPKRLVGIWASCILISRAEASDTRPDVAAKPIAPMHQKKPNKDNTASSMLAVKRYLRVAANLGAPLQVAIVWKLMGSSTLQFGLRYKEQQENGEMEKKDGKDGKTSGKPPPQVPKSNIWLYCVTMIICALGLGHASRKSKFCRQRRRRTQKVVEQSRLREVTNTLDHQEQRHTTSPSPSSTTSDLMLPAPTRGVTDDCPSSNSDLVLPAPTRSVTDAVNRANSQQLRTALLARHVKGVVKDRCKSINDSLLRQPSVEAPELTTRFRRKENLGGKIQALSKRFESETPVLSSQRRKSAPAGAPQPRHSDCELPTFAGSFQTTKSSEGEGQSESMMRLIAG